jgi:DHA1 family tetracycline resistance protein-like MFS transporter
MTVKRNAALGFIFITILIDVIGLGIIIPVFPNLIQQLVGGSISNAAKYGSWLTACYAVMQFLFSPIVGALSDRYGRRPILLFSLLGLGLDYVFQAFAGTITLLFIGRIIAGMAGASYTTATAYIADISEPEKKAQNFGMVGAAFGLGFIIGPLIGGFASHWGVRMPFVVAAVFSLLNLVYGYFVLPESLLKENQRPYNWKRANPIGSLMHLRRYPIISGLTISFFLIYIAAHSVQSNWTFYTKLKFDWTPDIISYSLATVGILIGLVQGVLIRITMPKLGAKNSVYVGLILYIIGMALFAFADKGWEMFVFLIPYCLGGICGPALQGIISNQVPANEQGELQGALTSLISVTSIIGPLVMNNTFAYFSGKNAPIYFPGAPFILGALLVTISIFFAINSLRTYHRSSKEAA